MVPCWYCPCMLNLQGIHTEKNYNWCVCVCMVWICGHLCKIQAHKNKQKHIRCRGSGICVISGAPGPMYETNGRLKKWWFVYHVKNKWDWQYFGKQTAFCSQQENIFSPFLCDYVPWSWQTKDNVWQIQVHYFEGEHNFQNMLYSCPLPCWHFLAHI